MRRFGPKLIVATCVAGLAGSALAQPATQPAAAAGPSTRPAFVYPIPEGQPVYAPRGYVSSFYPQWPTTTVPAEQVSQSYSCVIRIDSDSQSPNVGFPIVGQDSQTAAALLTSTALMDPAAKAALGLTPAQRQESVVVNVVPVGQQMARIEVTLKKSEGRHYAEGDAAKLGDALIDRLKAALDAAADASRKAALARREPVEKELAATKAKIDELHAKQRAVRAMSGDFRGGYSDPTFELNNLRNQKKSTESELARNRARLATLEPNVAPLIAQWADVVNLRQKQLDDLKTAAPAGNEKASTDAIRAAEDKLAEAKAQLAQARQAAVQPDTNNASFRTNEIVTLHTNIADEERRLKDYDAQIEKVQDPKYLALLDQVPDMQNEENRLRSQTFELQNRLDQIRRSTQQEGTVTVTVLDGRNAR